MKRGVCILCIVMAWLQTVCAGEWQWAVTLKGFVSEETKKEPEAFLWVPAHCERLSAVMWSQQNMTEEMLFDMPSFRDSLAEMGVGLIWIAPGIDQQWDVRKGTQKVFDQMMNDLAEVSGYNGIPYRLTEGIRQHILFPGLEDVKAGSAPLPLKAVSDSGLPVYYYVKEGPARITANNTLEFTPIPPRSRFPVKVTVVTWQYGLKGKVQTAESVERSFYIYK